MIVVMRAEATPDQVQHVKDLISDMGLTPHPIVGTDLTVVAVIGDDRKKEGSVLETAPGVDRVMKVLKPYKMSAKTEHHPKTTPVRVGEGDGCVFGGPNISVIAGPCSVESRDQILASARAARAAGAHALRGGAFKPRTNPYSFQGLGEQGLELLAEARAETGLPIVTEVVAETDIELVDRYADCLQIGTRNAQNFRLLEAVGKSTQTPVLFKRGMWMTLDEYLQATEYLLAHGNPNVILCERGIRTFEKFSRNTLSLAAVAELKDRTHLPVVSDPSHGTGVARLVASMSRASIAAGADGLALEMHPDPQHAMTDGAQSIDPAALAELMPQLARVAEAVGRNMLLPETAAV
ncbi:MAG: 3-deoxy-7-phosphoheptulonate synthase [Planctomycetota bacterium]